MRFPLNAQEGASAGENRGVERRGDREETGHVGMRSAIFVGDCEGEMGAPRGRRWAAWGGECNIFLVLRGRDVGCWEEGRREGGVRRTHKK